MSVENAVTFPPSHVGAMATIADIVGKERPRLDVELSCEGQRVVAAVDAVRWDSENNILTFIVKR